MENEGNGKCASVSSKLLEIVNSQKLWDDSENKLKKENDSVTKKSKLKELSMSIRKKHITRHYTLIEVMVAMGIFLIMMTIMMQFFTSAQQMWNISSKRNNTYADARVAMNLMTREIQCMLYRNDDTDGTAIYPFWYQWTDINDDGKARPAIKAHFLANNDLSPHSASPNSGDPYLTALNFIANTNIKQVDKGSDVCEIRYKFIPVYFTDATPESINDVKGGTLQRSCTEEYYDNSGTDTLTPSASGEDYNFATNSYAGVGGSDRVDQIWQDNTTVNVPNFRTVISGVYTLRFTCYAWFKDTTTPPDHSQMITLVSMDASGNAPVGSPITATGEPPLLFPYTYNLAMGTPAPVAVRIDMKLLAPEDLKKLAFAIYNSDEKQIRTLKQKMRSFSKVIYLGKREE